MRPIGFPFLELIMSISDKNASEKLPCLDKLVGNDPPQPRPMWENYLTINIAKVDIF